MISKIFFAFFIRKKAIMEFRNRLIAHGIIKMNNQVLIIKRSEIKRGVPNTYASYWDVPGGTVEDKETPRAAVVRETFEEVGLHVKVGKILHEDSQYDASKNALFTRLVYECELIDEMKKIILDPEEHSDYKWISSLEECYEDQLVFYVHDIFKSYL